MRLAARTAGALLTLVAVIGVGVVGVAGPVAAHPGGAALDYRWAGQVPWSALPPAEGRTAVVPASMLAAGSVDVWTPDLQAVAKLSVPDGADEPSVAITPVDPADLAALPDGAGEANGNAYRVAVDGAGWADSALDLLLQVPFPATGVLRLAEGGWVPAEVLHLADGGVRVVGAGEGTFVAVAPRTDGHDTTWAVLTHQPAWLAVAAVALLLIPLLRRRPR